MRVQTSKGYKLTENLSIVRSCGIVKLRAEGLSSSTWDQLRMRGTRANFHHRSLRAGQGLKHLESRWFAAWSIYISSFLLDVHLNKDEV